MKSTKDRILATALDLFNAEGLSQVTLRTIAKSMGISQGNLNYHYKKRDEIIEGLYFELVSNIDFHLSKFKDEAVCLSLLMDLSTSIMGHFYQYRFFLLDFVQIIRTNKTIKAHYLKLSITRERQFMGLFKVLIEKGILREEVLNNEYVFLYKRFQIISDFWISSAHITHNRITNKVIEEYSEIINQSIFPYLTKKGQLTYLKY